MEKQESQEPGFWPLAVCGSSKDPPRLAGPAAASLMPGMRERAVLWSCVSPLITPATSPSRSPRLRRCGRGQACGTACQPARPPVSQIWGRVRSPSCLVGAGAQACLLTPAAFQFFCLSLLSEFKSFLYNLCITCDSNMTGVSSVEGFYLRPECSLAPHTGYPLQPGPWLALHRSVQIPG